MTTPPPTETLGSRFGAVSRIAVYASFTLAMIPVQVVALLLGKRFGTAIPRWYHRYCCRLLGIRVERRGRQSRRQPTLYVVNHTSYLDISVLGALISGSFVAKAEVASWPFFGQLARLQRSVFIDRQTFRSADHRNVITTRLEAGDSLILFPEGTSSDGNRVLPFKSSLLSVAGALPQGEPLTVQPVSVAYTLLDGWPMGRYLRPAFAWYGDMDMATHLWQWTGLGRLTVVVQFHPTVTLQEYGTRKALSEHCYRVISRGVADALAGRRRSKRKAAPGPGPAGEQEVQGDGSGPATSGAPSTTL